MGDRRRQAVSENGIDPQILYLQTTLGQTAMIAGEIDMYVYSDSLLASARLQGADVTMVVSFLNRPLYRPFPEVSGQQPSHEELDKSGYIDAIYRQ